MSVGVTHRQPHWRSVLSFSVYCLGSCMIALALTAYATQWQPNEIFAWLEYVFSAGFILLFTPLLIAAVYSAWLMPKAERPEVWYETGMQAAGGIATLALTFTLLGISLGIGALGEQNINLDSIQAIIQRLTRHFSTAFMTTVVGLPTAGLLRAVIAIRWANHSKPKRDDCREVQTCAT